MYQQFIKNILYPLDCFRDRRLSELRWQKEFERTQFCSAEEIRRLAWKRLVTILDYAYLHIPFYRQRFDSSGFQPRAEFSEEEFLKIPPLEKRELQIHRDKMVDQNWPKKDLILDKTGGSTGTPVSYYRSGERHQSRTAATWRHNRWAGWDIGDKSMALWGAQRDTAPPPLRTRLKQKIIGRNRMFNTGGFHEVELLAFHDDMKRYRPKILLGYANSIALLAHLIRDRGLLAYQPTSIVSTAEMLQAEDRTVIESVFGCQVYNRYGCREVSVIASECEQHDGLHIMGEGLYIELVKDGKHALEGEVGEVVVTDMLNFPMPLIRYRVGDMASWAYGSCPCGRGLPRLKEITGRVTDYVVGMDGRLCSGAVLTVAMVANRPSLGQVQILQEEAGKVCYRIASGTAGAVPEEDLQFLRRETARYLGSGTTIEFEFVDNIPREASGKFLFSKSNVAATRLTDEER